MDLSILIRNHKRHIEKALASSLLVAGLLLTSCSNEKKAEAAEQSTSSVSAINQALPKHSPIEFPRDEGVHRDRPIEWWYLNAQFINAAGKKYAFFYTKFSTG